jgi:hypothetical protein
MLSGLIELFIKVSRAELVFQITPIIKLEEAKVFWFNFCVRKSFVKRGSGVQAVQAREKQCSVASAGVASAFALGSIFLSRLTPASYIIMCA